MNRLGMLVCLSHVSPDTMRQTIRISRAPVIFSHSSARAVADHPRNIPDDVLEMLPRNGGLAMVNFYSGFVVPEAAPKMARLLEVKRELREKFPAEADYKQAVDQWHAANPIPAGHARHVVDHIEHIRKVAGIDHVGLGSDFDGVSKTPEQLEDVSCYPILTQELLDRGWTPEEIKKVLGGNILRVLREGERVSRRGS
jgi:membrane dipeptidase